MGAMMRVLRSGLIAILLASLALASSYAAAPAPPSPPAAAEEAVEITVLHTNDAHGALEPPAASPESPGGYARLATLVGGLRRSDKAARVFLVDAGDVLSRGDPLTQKSLGRANIALMNHLAYDLWTPGNGDFYDGVPNLQTLMGLARFSTLTANVKLKATGGLLGKESVIEMAGPVRVAFFGLCTVNTGDSYAAPLAVADAYETASILVPKLRRQADVVVAVSHLGAPLDLLLASIVPGIDLVVGGHTHTALPNGMRVKDPTGRETLVVQAGAHLASLGEVRLKVEKKDDKWQVVGASARLIPASADVKPDPVVKAMIARLAEETGLAPPAPLKLAAAAEGVKASPAPSATGTDLGAEAKGLAEAAAKRYGPDYVTQIDAQRHIVYVSALSPALLANTVQRMGAFADAERQFLFRRELPWNVTVILPTAADYRKSVPRAKALGYYHEATRTLQSISLSDVLFHEFTHALHHADQVAAGQRHAPWVCEGLAMLCQRSECRSGTLEILPGRDLDTLQQALRADKAVPLGVLCAAPHEAFADDSRADLLYAEAHYVMFYLHRLGMLEEFYETYKADYREDPSGARSLEKVLGKPLGEAGPDWRAWILAQPAPWRPVRAPTAVLGIRMEAVEGGVRIAAFVKGQVAEKEGSLKIDDVVLSIAGQATPAPRDLSAAVEACHPGEIVDIEVIRGGRTTVVKQLLGVARK
jgi:hypothetical protein